MPPLLTPSAAADNCCCCCWTRFTYWAAAAAPPPTRWAARWPTRSAGTTDGGDPPSPPVVIGTILRNKCVARIRNLPSSLTLLFQPQCSSRLGRSQGPPQTSSSIACRFRWIHPPFLLLHHQSKTCTWSGRLPFHSFLTLDVGVRLVNLQFKSPGRRSSIRGNSTLWYQRHGDA